MSEKTIANSPEQILFDALLKIAKKRRIGVIYDYKPRNWSSPSMLIIIRDEFEELGGFFIAINPELTLAEKAKSLAVNLGFYKLSQNLNRPFTNLVQPSNRLALWFEEYRGCRDLAVDRYTRRLLTFLVKNLYKEQRIVKLKSQSQAV